MILGPLAILLSWLMFGYVFYTMRHLRHPTFSKLAASAKQTYLLFAVCLSVSGILIYIFMLKWFINEFALPTLFTVLATLAITVQFVTAWVPDTKGWKHRLHHEAAWTEAWLLMPMALLISASPNISILIQAWCALVILIMLFLVLSSYKITNESRFVYYQAAYIMCFHIIILTTTFSRVVD